MKAKNNGNYMISYGLCSLEQSVSILNNVSIFYFLYVCVTSHHLKFMTHLGLKLCGYSEESPFRTLMADLHLTYRLNLYIHFYYIYIKSTQILEVKEGAA